MKGKYTNAAERRRHLDDLTERAESGERRAAKFQAELIDLRAESDRQIGDLRRQVEELKRQRDAVASPALDVALQDNQKLRRRIEELKSEWAGGNHAFALLKRHASTALRKAGLTEVEIGMVWSRATTEAAADDGGEIGRIVDVAVCAEDVREAS